MKNEDIVRVYDKLFAERQGSVDQTWDLVERFVLPLRGEFYVTLNSENEVDWRRREVYDSTAVFAAQSLAAAMQSNLTSPAQRWFELRFRNDELNTQKVAMAWLEQCTNLVYQALAESNFETEIAEAYTDLVGFGTTLLTEEFDDGQLVFAANPLRDTVFEQDHRKDVHKVYRCLKWTAAEIDTKFETVPEKIQEVLETVDGATQRFDVIFCVYPRKEKENADVSKPLAPKERPFGYKYVLKDGHELLEEGGYYEMPCFVTRWRTVAGSKWGKSPSIDAMGDILTLNQLKEATLEAAAKAIDPPMKSEDGAVIGDIDLDRGGHTVLQDIDGLQPMMPGTNFDVSNLLVEWHANAIRNHFFQNQLELKESPAMTATEVNVRYELMQRMMGPTLSRLKNDLLDPLIQRTFNILYREGRLPEIPEGIPASRLDIQYTGPMPRAQQGNTANEIVRWLGEMSQLAQIYPELQMVPKAEEAARVVAELRGVPAKVIRSQQEMELIRKKQEQQRAMQQQLAMAQAGGEAMKSAGEGAKAVSEIQ